MAESDGGKGRVCPLSSVSVWISRHLSHYGSWSLMREAKSYELSIFCRHPDLPRCPFNVEMSAGS